jgi:hypothetical protein
LISFAGPGELLILRAFGVTPGLLSFGVIFNDATVPQTLVTDAPHQTSILVMFFAAFTCGAATI